MRLAALFSETFVCRLRDRLRIQLIREAFQLLGVLLQSPLTNVQLQIRGTRHLFLSICTRLVNQRVHPVRVPRRFALAHWRNAIRI